MKRRPSLSTGGKVLMGVVGLWAVSLGGCFGWVLFSSQVGNYQVGDDLVRRVPARARLLRPGMTEDQVWATLLPPPPPPPPGEGPASAALNAAHAAPVRTVIHNPGGVEVRARFRPGCDLTLLFDGDRGAKSGIGGFRRAQVTGNGWSRY